MRKDYTYAVVRSLADSFVDAIQPSGTAQPIDVTLAREQHDAYVAVLDAAGVRVRRIDADERYPDCCFVEDPAVVVDDLAIVCRMAASSRQGEEVAVERELSRRLAIMRMMAPANMDGGDVMRVGSRLFVGLTERTNTEAVQQLRYSLGEEYPVTPVEVRGALHLKSACTHVGAGVILVDPESVDPDVFSEFTTVSVPADERYAANCLSVNGTVVVSAGYPRTRGMLAEVGERAGFRVVELSMSEFKKAGGSLTCLSILY